MAHVVAVSCSGRKGVPKSPAESARVVEGCGPDGYAHPGPGPRHVSPVAHEATDVARPLRLEGPPGALGRNWVSSGLYP